MTIGSDLGTNSVPNGFPMHAHGLILGEDGATACTDLVGHFPAPFAAISEPFSAKILDFRAFPDPRGRKSRKKSKNYI